MVRSIVMLTPMCCCAEQAEAQVRPVLPGAMNVWSHQTPTQSLREPGFWGSPLHQHQQVPAIAHNTASCHSGSQPATVPADRLPTPQPSAEAQSSIIRPEHSPPKDPPSDAATEAAAASAAQQIQRLSDQLLKHRAAAQQVQQSYTAHMERFVQHTRAQVLRFLAPHVFSSDFVSIRFSAG